jgi:uncharacterized membrane protein YfcA
LHSLDATQIGVLALAGLAAGAINAIAGGGSLISFPALLSVGYPAVAANVTNTVALVPGYLGGSLAYRPELVGQSQRVRALSVVSVGGGLLGSILLVSSPASLFRSIVPWLILFSCALLALQPTVARLVGSEQEADHHPTVLLGVQFLAAVYGGYFGAGLGVLMLAVLATFLHDTLQRLNALKGLLSLIINVIAALFFALFGPVAWLPVLIMALASLLGGHLGVHLARRLSSRLLRAVVIAFGVIVALRLLIS